MGSVSDGPPPDLTAGRVGRPHGLDGSFYVTDPRPRMLALGARVSVAGQEREIVRRAGVEQRPILRLEGIENRSAAELLRGAALGVEREHAPTLPEGEWWAQELEGCIVCDAERQIGTVIAMIELPSCEVLQVRRSEPLDGAELLVPMVSAAIRSIDVRARLIDVDLTFLGER